ncbi:2-oxoglutarate (2OG) and Fe(II)-dependent oxygenase superfamily protein [Forsythia ovata]|uniref:2-oxoglutarate (2OG) and Fe(II)-dependent oxygenase superfamily protein n=1 Tax=Forsythia ovata TaxID=205694 RepID=A0ABD1TUY0_9LAMI
MCSNVQSKIPILEFSKENLNPGTNSSLSISHSVRGALESYGCFIAVYEKFTSDLHGEMFKSAKELFDLPMEAKVKNKSNFAGSGYGGNFSIMPLFEYLGIENGASLEATKNFTNIMWPDGNDSFCGTAHSYCKLLLELDHTVIQMVANSYGLENFYNSFIESSFYLTRFMKYRVPKEDENNIGLLPHTDKNFMSIIHTNHVRGLEIETRDGEWIDLQPSPFTFLVIAGEPMMAWSNGRIHAPLHRVVIRGKEEKYSIGNFSLINGMVQVPEKLVNGENQLKFKPFSHPAFLEYCKQGGPTMESAIKSFSGI